MKLDPLLLEILVCPSCKASLTVDQDNDELICNGCGLIYPVRDDIPVMLVDEARRPVVEAVNEPNAEHGPPAQSKSPHSGPAESGPAASRPPESGSAAPGPTA
ncbi:MAG: Trm112 family protein [Nocardioidaceae bacterium]